MKLITGIMAALSLTLAACGGSSSGDPSGLGLNDFDTSAENMVTGSASDSLMFGLQRGTPPLMRSIDDSDIESLFFGDGFFDAYDPSDNDLQSTFWNGQGACHVIESNGYAFQNIMEAGTSLCYMQNLPNAESGVEVVSGDLSDISNVFNQGTEDRIVKIQITAPTGDGEGGGGPEGDMTVFIKVYGSNNISENKYNADLWFCKDGGTVKDGKEKIRIDLSEKTVQMSSMHDDNHGTFRSDLTAHIKSNGSRYIFDADFPRTVELTHHSDDWGSFRSRVTADGDKLYNYSYNTFTWEGGDGPQENSFKTFVVSTFTGEKFEQLRILASGFRNLSESGDFDPWENVGAMDYDEQIDDGEALYEAVSSGDLYDLANDFSFASEDLYDSIESPDVSEIADTDCDPDVDVTIQMDFADPNVESIASGCETHFRDMNFCSNSSQINDAMQQTFEEMAP